MFRKIREKRRKKKLRDSYIAEVMEATGWDYDLAKAKIDDARKRLEITYKDYSRAGFYNIPEEDQKAAYNKLIAKKKRKEKRRKYYIAEVMEATGLDYDLAKAKMDDARKRLKITYKDYSECGFYNIPFEKQKEKYEELLDKRRKKALDNKEHYINLVMDATGWDREHTLDMMKDARERTGCWMKEYAIYKFYDLDEKTQEEFLLASLTKKISNKYNPSIEFVKMLEKKSEANKFFDEYLRRPWCNNTDISLEDFTSKFKDCSRIIYKPLRGIGGKGIQDFCITEDNMAEVYHKISNLEEGIVEKFLVQHEELARLAPASINTIRIVTISSTKKTVTPDGKHFDIAYSSLRIGNGIACVDNFHSGGMVAVIDLNTGTLITDAADMEGNIYASHPLTGVKIKGFKVPYFKEALKMVTEICEKKQISGNIGWDIAIDRDGPVIIEVNTGPGGVLLQTPYIGEKKGMKYVMEKYL